MTTATTETADARKSGAADGAGGKSIVLFSDGTGNSSAKLFKTNVWRLYEAVDLGPPASGKRPQISYYDDGVGTSSFKPLAALGGAFGWGLKRNVLDIYRYACRNYRDGDDIYAFGFSRGAFTARLVVALIAIEGLVRSDSEAELRRKTVAAYRAFRRSRLPRRLQWPTKVARRLRNTFLAALDRLRGHAPYDSSENARPDIRFIGVWDTVAAYGGPITEITRAVDNWFFPLSMPDYRLHERVRCARHALALDDERDAFHPLLWDEVHEASQIDEGKVAPDRLQQVWFTGMHADVGGGYPDESLSYVSLLWMMEEAERCGLRTLTVIKDRIVALASSFGPLHNSRAGLGAYYRYHPRKIAAWLDPVQDSTLSLRDPAITDAHGRSRGLLRSVHVHESVINRIATGTDRYAPITLPGKFDIVPPQEHGENVAQADSDTSGQPPVNSGPKPLLDQRVIERLNEGPATERLWNRVWGRRIISDTPGPRAGDDGPKPLLDRDVVKRVNDEAATRARAEATERLWNRVWGRRIIYFATLAATLLLVGLPLIVDMLPPPPILADGRTWIGGVIRLLTIVLPSFASAWVDVYANAPFYFLLFGAVVVAFLAVGTWMERTLRDEARRVWRQALAGRVEKPGPSRVQVFRNSASYQRTIRRVKWFVLPDVVITPMAVVFLAWFFFAAYVQTALPFLENGTALCRSSAAGAADILRVSRDFFPRDVCSGSFGLMQEGRRYVVTIDVLDRWHDATVPASPEGLSAGELPAGLGYVATPFKRVIDARYLQPLLEIRPHEGARGLLRGNIQIYPLSVRQVGDTGTLFRADFEAPRSGEVFVFVNDAMLPFTGARWGKYDASYFYRASGSGDAGTRGNRGSACVTIALAEAQDRTTEAPPNGSVCERTAGRRLAASRVVPAD